MLTQLDRLMARMVLCGLLALLAWPTQAQAQDDSEVWASWKDYVPSEAYRNIEICGEYSEGECFLSGQLMILIREGYDGLVERLWAAATQGRVEIGWRSWDQLAADMDLIRIWPLSGATDFGRRRFLLFFPDATDKCAMYELFTFYSSLPYIGYVAFNGLVPTTGAEIPSAISETTWGFIKHHQLDLSRKVFHVKD